ncbi:hypothetical protein Moror_5991 [Moniliophthora roreri MCA 2997]|uniref:Uncharacterized protein n=2 Tax=Moniliophthora roreri TaxID=221103 RepID=V2WYR1_MONRO|nr:hypothetical protein Moror_5991 [Moniliophthora roreri MCA 2997]
MDSEEIGSPTVVNRSEIGKRYSALDGRVSTFVDEGHLFVTSPNSNEIYIPYDPLSYSQPFIPDHCHWAALQHRPSSGDPAAIWWDAPPAVAFSEDENGAAKGMGMWDATFLEKFKADYEALQSRVLIYSTSQHGKGQDTNSFISALSPHLEQAMNHLTSFALPYHRTHQLFSYFQQWYLELKAALDWIEVYQPSMTSRTMRISSGMAEPNAMGAFLSDATHCEMFFLAGLPFWLVRPHMHHHLTCIDHEVVPLTPTSLHIQLDPFTIHSRNVVFSGTGNDKAKAFALEDYGRSLVRFTDPFSMASEPDHPEPSLPPTNTSSGACGTSHSQNWKGKRSHSPYTKPQKTSTDHNKFTEIKGPYTPPVPDVWVQALGATDRSKQPQKAVALNSGYAFPEPGLILYAGLTSTDRMVQYLKTWLHFRAVLIFHHQLPFLLPTAPPAAYGTWSPKQWRTLLALHNKSSDSGVVQARQRKSIWKAKQSKKPAIVMEIIWELFELNFCFEFHALNSKLGHSSVHRNVGMHDITSFEPLVQNCFPGSTGIWNPTQINWAQSNNGLAASELRRHAKFFLRMRDIVKQWPKANHLPVLQSTKSTIDEYSDNELVEMEQTVAQFYCQSFYKTFGQPPITPHRLDTHHTLGGQS